jgi:hypothetical protein
MAGSPAKLPPGLRAQDGIHIFERAKEAREGTFETGRALPSLLKVNAAELIRASDYGRSHGSILVRSLRPREVHFRIDPERESHLDQYIISYDAAGV